MPMSELFTSNGGNFLHNFFNNRTLQFITQHKDDPGLEVEISLGCGNNWYNTPERKLRYNSYCTKSFIEEFQYYLETRMSLQKTSRNYTVHLAPGDMKFSSYRKFHEKGDTKTQRKKVLLTRDDLISNNRMRISSENDVMNIFQTFDSSIFNNSEPLQKSRDTYTWCASDSDMPFCRFDLTTTTENNVWFYQVEVEFVISSLFYNLTQRLGELYELLTDFNTVNKKWLYMSRKIPLPTIQRPVTLKREHIQQITEGYACTRKYDGLRCFLVFDNNDTYLMDIRGKIRIIDKGVLRQFKASIILDCEFINTPDGQDSCHIFDCIFDGVNDTHLRSLKERVQLCKHISTLYQNKEIDILAKRIEMGDVLDSIQVLKTRWCNYETDGLIFIPKEGSYFNSINKVYKYKPIELITVDVLVDFTENSSKIPMKPYCKDDHSRKLIPLVSKLDLSLFTKTNISRVIGEGTQNRDKFVIECKIDENKLIPYRYRVDKINPNKKFVILDNLNVILQMKQSLHESEMEDCLDLWITEFKSIGKNKNEQLQSYVQSLLTGKNILLYCGYESIKDVFNKPNFMNYSWTVLNWRKPVNFNAPSNVSYVAYDAYPLESIKHDHILGLYTSCFQNDIQIQEHIQILEERIKINLAIGSSVVLMFTNSNKDYQSSFLKFLNVDILMFMNSSSVSEWDVYIYKFKPNESQQHSSPDLDKICDTYDSRSHQIFEQLICASKNENFLSTHPIKFSTQPIVH